MVENIICNNFTSTKQKYNEYEKDNYFIRATISNELHLNIAKDDLISVIDALKNEKLLYSNKDCSEIVTIINAEEIN